MFELVFRRDNWIMTFSAWVVDDAFFLLYVHWKYKRKVRQLQQRLHWKELTSRAVGLSLPGLYSLSLSLLRIAGMIADQENGKNENSKHFFSTFFQ